MKNALLGSSEGIILARRGRLRLRVKEGVMALTLVGLAAVGLNPRLIQADTEETLTVRPADGDAVTQQNIEILDTAASSGKLIEDIQALTAMPMNEVVERFAPFRYHAHNKSRLNHEIQLIAPPAGAVTLQPGTGAIIRQIFDMASNYPAAVPVLQELLSHLNGPKSWRLLEGLELAREFRAASLLAANMLTTETDGEHQALLSLITARNRWLSRPDEPGEAYASAISVALGSSNETIRSEAESWHKATTQPNTYESLILCHHVWETVHMDIRARDASGLLARKLVKNGATVYEQVYNADLPAEEKQRQLGRVLSVTAEGAFNQWNHEVQNWCKAQAAGLGVGADAEDKLTPAYFQAYGLYAMEKNAEAMEAFQEIFLSEVQCDVAADSGVMVARCCRHLSDTVGMTATLQLLLELYPNQDYVIIPATSWLDSINAQGSGSQQAVQTYIEEKYRKKLEVARARRPGRENDSRRAALKESPKKVALSTTQP